MSAPPEPRLKVLLVEDDEDVRRFLRLHLESRCQLVGEADSGEAALPMVSTLRPDVVVMAVDLPGADGIAVTEKLRPMSGAPAVLILSSHREPEMVRKALAAGAREYLFKPIESRELIAALQRVARDWRARTEAAAAQRAPGAGLWTFVSACGGCGTTSFLLSVANELRATGRRVVVVDANAPLGDIGLYLGMDARPPSSADLCLADPPKEPGELAAFLKHHPSGIDALLGPTDPYAASAMDHARLVEGILGFRQLSDYVLVDLPPGIPERLLPLLDEARYVLVAGSPRLNGLKNLRTWVRLLQQLEYPAEKVKPVLIGCEEGKTPLAEYRKVMEAAGAEISLVLPADPAAADAAIRACVPMSRAAPRSAYAGAIRDTLMSMLEVQEKPAAPRRGPSALARLLGFGPET